MNTPNLPKLVEIPPKMWKRFGKGKMLVPSPLEIEALIRTVRKGKLVTVPALKEYLAGKFGANSTCPLATGIFVRIVAEAAEEDAAAGNRRITPYWRVVKEDGSLNPKFPGGVARQAGRLMEEGHRILPGRGKQPPRVAEVSRSSGRIAS